MAFFNFIETFFFISLGITFILVLSLVYHFKQRICGLEQKCDTMFEIINDIVKQLNTVRLQNNVPFNNMPFMNVFNPVSKSMPEIQHFINESMDIDETKRSYDYVEGDNDEDDEDDDAEDEEDDDEEDEDDDEEDDEDDDEEDDDEDDDEEDDEDDEDDDEDDKIKVINVNINDSNDSNELTDFTELQIEELTDNNIENGENEDEVDNIELVDNTETINVEKIMPSHQEDNHDTNDEKEMNKKESEKEVYKKMSLSALKTLVISKGLCSDASKLKKPDLLKLLENVEE
jgi:hypothetical protein